MPQTTTAARRLPGNDDREQLRQIIKSESLLKGDFTLASGQKSSYFLDLKKTIFHPQGAALVAEVLFGMIKDEDVDYIGGLEIGAIPIVTAIAARSFPERPIKAFFVRKAVKDHGTSKLIDGQFAPNSKVAIIEDVTTTGGSVMKAVNAVREQGCSVRKIFTVVDRLEGATENLKREGLQLVPVFTIRELD
jgi:orotate phosphoribosyltransferase